MEGLPYYGAEESKWKRNLEGLIPLVILLLIAVVLIGKTTSVFCNVPVLGAVFCAKTQVNIGILGDINFMGDTNVTAPKFKTVLDSEGVKYNIYTQPIPVSALEFPRETLLKNFDIVVVVGVKQLTYAARDALGNYISSGGKVILIGDSGTKDPVDALIKGWSEAAFGDSTPVRLNMIGTPGGIPMKTIDQPVLNMYGDHPVLKNYADMYLLNLSEVNCNSTNAVDAVPVEGANTIAVLTSSNNSSAFAVGIVEKSALFGGSVLYFNYDPGCTRGIAIAAVHYLAGR